MTTLRRLLLFVLSFCVLVAWGCAKDPADGAPAAEVTAAEPTADEPASGTVVAGAQAAEEAAPSKEAPTVETPAADEKVVTRKMPLTGTIGFEGSKVTGSHHGVFKRWKGQLILTKTKKAKSMALSIKVHTDSVYADPDDRGRGSEKLEEHLKGKDFFAVSKYPIAEFESTSIIEQKTSEGHSHKVTGNLSLRGVTKEVSFPATLKVEERVYSGRAEFSISRKDFGIVYAGKPDDLIRDRVVLRLDLSTVSR